MQVKRTGTPANQVSAFLGIATGMFTVLAITASDITICTTLVNMHNEQNNNCVGS